ncbi:MAG: hypothetical protein HYZ29_20070 [Myxococcales bacterium]|nr:hypothetical protein [Myxococcales bacterium]
MIELEFRCDLYAGGAVEAAVKVYSEHAKIARVESADAFVLRVEAAPGVDERLLADELGNYVLGATVELRGE